MHIGIVAIRIILRVVVPIIGISARRNSQKGDHYSETYYRFHNSHYLVVNINLCGVF